LIFITLGKFRQKPTKESGAQANKLFEKAVKEGAKILGMYWTLGRYDAVIIIEGRDEKVAMKTLARFGDIVSTETLVAVPREEAIKLLE
jgi:uncharacterized protein with GYD domain